MNPPSTQVEALSKFSNCFTCLLSKLEWKQMNNDPFIYRKHCSPTIRFNLTLIAKLTNLAIRANFVMQCMLTITYNYSICMLYFSTPLNSQSKNTLSDFLSYTLFCIIRIFILHIFTHLCNVFILQLVCSNWHKLNKVIWIS